MAEPSTAVEVGNPKPTRAIGKAVVDDAETTRRDRYDGEDVDEAEGDDERVEVGRCAERTEEHPQCGGIEYPVGCGPPEHARQQPTVAGQVLEPQSRCGADRPQPDPRSSEAGGPPSARHARPGPGPPSDRR